MSLTPFVRSSPGGKPTANDLAAVHPSLAHWNHERLSPSGPTATWRDDLAQAHTMLLQEGGWVERLRAQVAEQASQAPRTAAAFVAWFEDLQITGPGQHDPLFRFLAEDATREELRWFLTQEAAGEAGFDDLVA